MNSNSQEKILIQMASTHTKRSTDSLKIKETQLETIRYDWSIRLAKIKKGCLWESLSIHIFTNMSVLLLASIVKLIELSYNKGATENWKVIYIEFPNVFSGTLPTSYPMWHQPHILYLWVWGWRVLGISKHSPFPWLYEIRDKRHWFLYNGQFLINPSLRLFLWFTVSIKIIRPSCGHRNHKQNLQKYNCHILLEFG